MQTSFWPTLRPLTLFAHCLCALSFCLLAAPTGAAAATGPVVSAKIGPSSLTVTGGVITVTATVTDSTAAITSVQANVSLNGGYYGENNVTLSNGGSGNVYSAVVPSGGSNTGSANEVYTATVTATNDLNLSNTAAVTGQTLQAGSGPPAGSIPILYTTDETKPVLSPASATAGSPAITMTINGGNFAAGATVLFNGVTLTPSGITLTQIAVPIPAVLLAEAGSYTVSVVNPSPGGTSNSVNFNVH